LSIHVSETFPPPEPAAAPRAPFRLPGDYYTAPVSEVRPVFEKWVPFGCGTLAILFVLVLFIGGAFAARGGMGSLFDSVFSIMQGELTNALAADVTPQQRTALNTEYQRFRANVRANRLDMARVQTLLKSMSEVSEDKKVTGAEAQRLTNELHDLNASAK
jgi:hypothetical protein